MDAREFHNALRILTGLDIDDLRRAGVIDENWGTPEASDRNQIGAFIRAPFDEALRMPDVNFDRLFALIESRQPKSSLTKSVMQLHDETMAMFPIFDGEDRSSEAA